MVVVKVDFISFNTTDDEAAEVVVEEEEVIGIDFLLDADFAILGCIFMIQLNENEK